MSKSAVWPAGAFIAACLVVAVAHYTGAFASFEGTLIGAGFIVLAFFAASRQGIKDRQIGLVVRPITRTLMPAIWAALIIFPVFSVGYLGWMHLWGHKIEIPTAPFTMYRPELTGRRVPAPGTIGLYAIGNEIIFTSRAGRTTRLHVNPINCDITRGRTALYLKNGQSRGVDLRRCRGFTVRADNAILVAPGHKRTPVLTEHRSWWNLVLLFLVELLGVALPEELFYRGYMQAALGRIFTKKVRILGAEMGWEVVIAAVLFALGHLITVPALFRLAVFFPGLLFGYLRERSGSLVAPIVFHAMSNCLMYGLQGFVSW